MLPPAAACETELVSIAELDEVEIRAIALETGRDVRTVRRVLRNEPVRGVAGAVIRRAIATRLARRAEGVGAP